MNENNQQANGADKATIDQKVSGKRRLLMKGAAGAVPAVLTLRSGAAFALTSAEMCNIQDNAIAAGANLRVAANANDIWLRKAVTCRDLTNGVRVYPDPFVPGEWRDENYIAGGTNTNVYVDVAVVFPAPAAMKLKQTPEPVPVPTFTYTTGTCYVLVIMDATGTAVDLGNAASGQNGNPGLPYVTASCWASASPTASAAPLPF